MDIEQLAQHLITYDTSRQEGLSNAAGFIKGWLEARDIDVQQFYPRDMPILLSTVGEGDITLVLHGHLDVVPGKREQFSPRVSGDRLYGRGAYDMKGALAAMMYAFSGVLNQRGVRVLLEVVPDEESEETTDRASDFLVEEGHIGDFAITGEPTDLHIGVQAKGVLAMRLEVDGKAAHGSTPWEGDNAVLRATEVYRTIEELPFTRESSDILGKPSVNLGRISGGGALNVVPDLCTIELDVRYLPGQDPQDIVEDVSTLPDVRVASFFVREPAMVEPDNPFVQVVCGAYMPHAGHDVVSVGICQLEP